MNNLHYIVSQVIEAFKDTIGVGWKCICILVTALYFCIAIREKYKSLIELRDKDIPVIWRKIKLISNRLKNLYSFRNRKDVQSSSIAIKSQDKGPVVVNVTACEMSLQAVSPTVFIPPQQLQPPPPPMPQIIPTDYYTGATGIQVGDGATVTVVGDLS